MGGSFHRSTSIFFHFEDHLCRKTTQVTFDFDTHRVLQEQGSNHKRVRNCRPNFCYRLLHSTLRFSVKMWLKSKIQRRDHGSTIIIGRESRKIVCIVFAGRKLSFPLPLASVSIASVEARRPASSLPRLFLYPNSLFVLMAYTFEKRVSSFLFSSSLFHFFSLFLCSQHAQGAILFPPNAPRIRLDDKTTSGIDRETRRP